MTLTSGRRNTLEMYRIHWKRFEFVWNFILNTFKLHWSLPLLLIRLRWEWFSGIFLFVSNWPVNQVIQVPWNLLAHHKSSGYSCPAIHSYFIVLVGNTSRPYCRLCYVLHGGGSDLFKSLSQIKPYWQVLLTQNTIFVCIGFSTIILVFPFANGNTR